jgi:hypothetical protein
MSPKARVKSAKVSVGDAKTQTRVIYLNLPIDIAAKLEAEAKAEDRPISVQAARILRQYFETKT